MNEIDNSLPTKEVSLTYDGQPSLFYAKDKDISFLKQQEYSNWKCELFGIGPTGITINPLKGKEPNWFWRWMQYVCFGNRWTKNV